MVQDKHKAPTNLIHFCELWDFRHLRVAIDAVGIRGHGGAAVLCELLHWLPRVRPHWEWHVFLFERELREFDNPLVGNTVTLEYTRLGNTAVGRLLWINDKLQRRALAIGAQVLFAFANAGSHKPAVPQTVFVQQPNAFFDTGLPQRAAFLRMRMRLLRWQILQGARASRSIIVQTEPMRERIHQLAPVLRGRVHVVPSGYRTPSPESMIRHEKKTIIDQTSHPRLIYVSHPSEHKNHLRLVEALPYITRHLPHAVLLITLDKDNPPNARYATIVRDIITTATSLGINDNLIWLGILTPDEVSYALSNSDLMVFPSLAESFGLGLVEAMAVGCPIAAADLPYAHDVAGGAAVYFDPTNTKEISRVVISILNQSKEISQLRAATKRLRHRYSYQNIADKIACILAHPTEEHFGALELGNGNGKKSDF